MNNYERNELIENIRKFKELRDEKVNPILDEYSGYIDDEIFQTLPFNIGNIIKCEMYGVTRYFIYRGIKDERMIFNRCDENGVESLDKRSCHWHTYEHFTVYKEVE
ncbi:MAG: hypothetical protein RR359_02780 [Bacilli bacterium]